MQEKNTNIKLTLFLFPVIIFFYFFSIKIFNPEFYLSSIQEDTILEYSQAILYLFSSIIALMVTIMFYTKKLSILSILYTLFTIGLCFIFLEEISWGQRVFGLENTEFFTKNNTQNEISLHNLNSIQPLLHSIYLIIGIYGSIMWIVIKKYVKKDEIKIFFNYIVPNWFLSSYFFFVFFIYFFLDYIRPFGVLMGIELFKIDVFFIWRDQEPFEFILALGFLLFTITKYYELKNEKNL